MCYNNNHFLRKGSIFERWETHSKCEFMKTIINNQKKYLIAIISLIFICEIMLGTNNEIVQVLGICIIPIICIYGILLIKNECKNI